MVAISHTLALGAGCYWGTEKYVVKDFQKKFPNSIKKAKVGFMSVDPENAIKNPNYRQVCSGTTGYVEVLYVELNDPASTFEPLVRFFFQFHDPTTKDRQVRYCNVFNQLLVSLPSLSLICIRAMTLVPSMDLYYFAVMTSKQLWPIASRTSYRHLWIVARSNNIRTTRLKPRSPQSQHS